MTVELCALCEAVPLSESFDRPQHFAHLRFFAEEEQDEFVTRHYHVCGQCQTLWHEWHSDYNTDVGWHWERMDWAEFNRLYGAKLAAPSPKNKQECLNWALLQIERFDLSDLFR